MLSHMNPVHTGTLHLYKIHFNTIFQSISWSSKCRLSLGLKVTWKFVFRRFEVKFSVETRTNVRLKIPVFCFYTPCRLVKRRRRFERCSTPTKVRPSKRRWLPADTVWHTQKPESSANFPSMPTSSKWYLSFRMSRTKPSMHFSSFPLESHATLSALFHHANNSGWTILIVMPITHFTLWQSIMKFESTPSALFRPMDQYKLTDDPLSQINAESFPVKYWYVQVSL